MSLMVKLVLEKAKKPASYELAIYTFFNILHKSFPKESFGYFHMNILTDFIPPSSLQQQGSSIA